MRSRGQNMEHFPHQANGQGAPDAKVDPKAVGGRTPASTRHVSEAQAAPSSEGGAIIRPGEGKGKDRGQDVGPIPPQAVEWDAPAAKADPKAPTGPEATSMHRVSDAPAARSLEKGTVQKQREGKAEQRGQRMESIPPQTSGWDAPAAERITKAPRTSEMGPHSDSTEKSFYGRSMLHHRDHDCPVTRIRGWIAFLEDEL